ncbi:putative ribonuclease H protein [Acorus calamus]|uniref:Ribonuclease H protein n=1 Tax=Acorus calamus TaxID=4465 RepID=A0AAV9F960_ACOCL|nr:putative ribonuclease H protein [Acorus calamus]
MEGRQRSKELWLQLGDNNSTYFHKAVAIRRRHNRIHALEFEGERVEDTKLRSDLEGPVTEEEILRVVRGTDGDKAPRPDGFGMRFYQSFWPIVHTDIIDMVNDVFLNRGKIGCINSSMFVLIPKKEGANSIGDYRPICLVNSSYMIISKLLANRVRNVSDELFEAEQAAFIPGRALQDSFMVTQELVAALHKDKRTGVALKLDFANAYDSVDWSFLLHVLGFHGFNSSWIHMIRQCISMAHASVVINGSLHGYFPINSRSGRNERGTQYTILQYADDTILFGEAEEETLQGFWFILKCFERLSGLHINFDKSVLLPINVGDQGAHSLASIIGCTVGEFPCKHLGLPLVKKRLRKPDWMSLVERLGKRLSGWKRKHLSYGGRVTLLQAVLTNLPVVFLSIFKLPKGVAHMIDVIRRRFLWNGTDTQIQRPYLVNWEAVCQRKCHGGLGILDLATMNKALLSKWLWNWDECTGAAWRHLIFERYGHLIRGLACLPHTSARMTHIAKGVFGLVPEFAETVAWRVGDGHVRFWEDAWCGTSTLLESFPLAFQAAACKVGSVQNFRIASTGQWNVTSEEGADPEVLAQFQSLHSRIQSVPILEGTRDRRVWTPDQDRGFSVRRAYDWWSRDFPLVPVVHGKAKVLWKLKIPHKVKVFMWIALQE